jgi:hypothetical protein
MQTDSLGYWYEYQVTCMLLNGALHKSLPLVAPTLQTSKFLNQNLTIASKSVTILMKLGMCIMLSLWSSGQSSYLQIQSSGFDSQRYQIFWEVVGLERGPLSLVSTIEELFERKSSGSGLENQNYFRRGYTTNFADRQRSLCQYS